MSSSHPHNHSKLKSLCKLSDTISYLLLCKTYNGFLFFYLSIKKYQIGPPSHHPYIEREYVLSVYSKEFNNALILIFFTYSQGSYPKPISQTSTIDNFRILSAILSINKHMWGIIFSFSFSSSEWPSSLVVYHHHHHHHHIPSASKNMSCV